ncbi:MAG: beta-ketoacyl-ACP synthase 3 [Actinobacteria bacterium]|nr:beta-ketoacyl-ACP synthase 3 [Actinomycetota bacterium]
MAVGIAGIGAHLPERAVSNDELAATLDTSDAWVRDRTGIGQRHLAADHVATSDLALAAGKAALADADLAAADLGAVIVATCTPDHTLPATATLVAARLGTTAPAFDLNAACSGFVYGIRLAAGLVAAGGGPVVLIGAETLSRIIDWTDRSTAVLFGDGAGAVVLAAGAGTVGPFDLGADGDLAELLIVPAGGSRTPRSSEPRDHLLHMHGREVYRHAVRRMAASSLAVLDAAGLTPDDVDLFVGHQANARILDAVTARVGIDPARAHVTVDRHANTSAASIPLALADAAAAGRIAPGARVLVTAFGGGLTWGSALLSGWEVGP